MVAAFSIQHSLNFIHTNTTLHKIHRPLLSCSASLLTQLVKNRTASPDLPSLWKILPNDSVADRVLIKEYGGEKKREEDRKEVVVASVVNRLMAVVERMREREIQKFMSKVGGEISYEDCVVLAEEASKEIVDKFLEKPIEYLRNNGGACYSEKVKDLNLLIDILENSCPANQR